MSILSGKLITYGGIGAAVPELSVLLRERTNAATAMNKPISKWNFRKRKQLSQFGSVYAPIEPSAMDADHSIVDEARQSTCCNRAILLQINVSLNYYLFFLP